MTSRSAHAFRLCCTERRIFVIVFLTSSPSGSYRQENKRFPCELDNRNGFADALRQRWPGSARMLLLAASPDDPAVNDSIRNVFFQAFLLTGLPVESFDICDRRDSSSADRLQDYDVLILAGGHVPTQNAFFKELSLREKIADFNGIVIGISAGTMNAADVVYVQPELPGESDSAFPRFTRGLGLTEFMLLPHVQEVRHDILDGKRLFEDLTFPDSMGHVFCALEDGSYLLIENNTTALCGAAWVISNGTMEKINEENEITLL